MKWTIWPSLVSLVTLPIDRPVDWSVCGPPDIPPGGRGRGTHYAPLGDEGGWRGTHYAPLGDEGGGGVRTTHLLGMRGVEGYALRTSWG